MQISLKWVHELVNIENIELNYLINKLTLGGFEVEEILEIEINNEKTITLDISATANRSDSLSIQGLSLEITALLNQFPKISKYSTENFLWFQKIQELSQIPLNFHECSGFISIIVENLTNLTSPIWLKQKLIASGLTPENNLTDFQNYIILENGYPFEFYDLEQIYSKLNNSKFNLTLTSANDLKEFSANNDTTYKLDSSVLILKANELPISIAGIISNNNVSCSNNTNSLLIEGSIFNAAKIRQQSRTLGLRTERSSRYEKSLKNTNLLESFYRLICLLRIENPNLISKLHTIAKSVDEKIRTILLYYKHIKEILGPIKKNNFNQEEKDYDYIAPEIITDLLKRLQFEVEYNPNDQIWKVNIPPLRNDDIVLEIDLIEEVGRLYGFNKFLTRLPNLEIIGTEDFYYQSRKKLTSCLVNLGLNELIQYSLVNKETHIINKIQLINPLIKDYSHLRVSLLPNLIKAVEENYKKGNSVLEGFEYGHIFNGNNLENLTEKEYIGGIFGGIKIKSSWSKSSTILNWFEAKGRIEQLFKQLNIIIYWKSYKPLNEKILLHPYCTAASYLADGTKLGIFGQIHPILAKQSGIPTDLYLFEFDFELIKNQIQLNKLLVYREYSSYPKIIKDVSFIIQDNISFADLQEILSLNGSKFLVDINLLDEYRGTSIPTQHTSLCLQFIFQSNQETLKNKKVEIIIENLKKVLTIKFNAQIRI